MKRHPKKQSGRDGRETDSRRGYAQDQYRGRGAKPIQRPFPPPKADAEVDNIVTLIKMSNKNYIALLHEYTKKIDRALMFKHDLRADRYHVPKKE